MTVITLSIPAVCADSAIITQADVPHADGGGERQPGAPEIHCPEEEWRIYCITRLADGRRYIGVTSRSVLKRFAAHCADARRKGEGRGRRPGTLTHALRQAIEEELDLARAFEVKELERCFGREDARHLERHWIEVLGAAQPMGFNKMPGGSSLGSVANALPVTLEHPTRGKLLLPTISAAVALRSSELVQAQQPRLDDGVVYARLATGWPINEALGYVPHVDGRALRAVMHVGGHDYTAAAIAAALGVSPGAWRSRRHRARRGGLTRANLAVDRRRRGGARAVPVPVRLPNPRDMHGAPLTTTAFAAATGLPKATVIHRLAQLRAGGRNPAQMPRAEVLAALLRQTDRRVLIELAVPRGKILRGGVRAVIRQVLRDAALAGSRINALGMSAIRARLRSLPGWPNPSLLHPTDLQWAFGFVRDCCKRR